MSTVSKHLSILRARHHCGRKARDAGFLYPEVSVRTQYLLMCRRRAGVVIEENRSVLDGWKETRNRKRAVGPDRRGLGSKHIHALPAWDLFTDFVAGWENGRAQQELVMNWKQEYKILLLMIAVFLGLYFRVGAPRFDNAIFEAWPWPSGTRASTCCCADPGVLYRRGDCGVREQESVMKYLGATATRC